jgi:2-methylcitrate dehydratase PrpD
MSETEKAANEAPQPQKVERLAEWAARQVRAAAEQADHSPPYLCAAALLDGEVAPAQFTDERVERQDVQQLMRCVWVRQRDELSDRIPQAMPCRVTRFG